MSILVLGIFWIGYGALGLLGIQNRDRKYKGTFLEKDYKKFSDRGYLILGILCIVAYLFSEIIDLPFWPAIIADIIILTPVIVYSIVWDMKFKKIFKEENKE